MDGVTTVGGSFSPGATFGDGSIFEGCTFYAKTTFGDGCVFRNCKFMRCCPPYYTNPWSTTGEGCVFENCSFDYIAIGPNATIHSSTFLACSVAGGAAIEAPGEALGQGGEWNVKLSEGQVVYFDGQWPFPCRDWVTQMCEKGAVVLSEKGSCGSGVTLNLFK